MSVAVEPLRQVSDEVFTRLTALVVQLSPTAPGWDRDRLQGVVDCPVTTVLIARVDGAVAGMLTLVVFPIPTGVRAWIEDVVVDEAARGRGAGAALTREAVRLAREAGARTVDLTSRPSRAAANRLYERLGFAARESNVYRLTVSD